MALRELVVERFRGIRSARVVLEPTTTMIIGENDCGKSSLLDALALVLSPLGERRPCLTAAQFHRETAASAPAGPVRIRVEIVESESGSWDRPGLEALAPVLGGASGARARGLRVELTADPPRHGSSARAHWSIDTPGGSASHDDPEALAAVRRVCPFVWLRGGEFVRPPADAVEGVASTADESLVLQAYERLVGGTTLAVDADIAQGHAAAERVLADRAPGARARRPRTRAVVREILGRSLEPEQGPRPVLASSEQDATDPALVTRPEQLGVLLLTARVLRQLRGVAPGARPVLAIEEPEAGLHPTTLASVWGLLERLRAQKIVTTHSGTLLASAPLSSVRRLVRGSAGAVREWRVREGALRRDELRKVSYHLRARRGAACFARCWLLVEGETEYWILPDLARIQGYDLGQEGVACVEFAQCGLGPLVKLARALGIAWHVLVDGDRAGQDYAGVARSFLRGDPESARISQLAERDLEHCFWRHGHAGVFERLAGAAARPGAPSGRVIAKAIEHWSKPGVAFELLAAAAAPGSAGPPTPLVETIETCVRLARGAPLEQRAGAPGGVL